MAVALASITAVTCFCVSWQILESVVYLYLHICGYLKTLNEVVMLHIITEKVFEYNKEELKFQREKYFHSFYHYDSYKTQTKLCDF
jgi:hypothetical protein